MNQPKHVLDGYKVLDFTQIVAGPTCTLMLAEMGAEVVKVELAPAGDSARVGPVVIDGRSGYFVPHNRGKKDLCIDAKTPEGLAILKQLVTKVDVLVENFAPGVIARLGLGYEVVNQLNPRIVMCSISAFGQNGPLAHEPGFVGWVRRTPGSHRWAGRKTGRPCFPWWRWAMSPPGLTRWVRSVLPCCTVSALDEGNIWTFRCSIPTPITMKPASRYTA